MNISSSVVTAVPEKRQLVIESLERLGGIEVIHVLDDGRIIVVMERQTTREETKAFRRIMDIEGVITANMAYHYFEEEVLEGRQS